MNNLIIRTLTGTAFVALLLASLWIGSYAFLLFFGAVVFIGTFEVVALVARKQKRAFALFCAFIALSVFWLSNGGKFACCTFFPYEYADNAYLLLFLIPLVGMFLSGDAKINPKPETRNPKLQIKLISAGLGGAFLLSISFTALATVFSAPNGYLLTMAFFCIVWTYDTFAYLVGSAIGRRRICEVISPKKSWEGAGGGFLFAIACGGVFFYFTDVLALWQWVVYAVIICVFGTAGDFCESLLKRAVNAKDSGKILPRHGGILDRFDSTIF
ncbi:MAG: phosphatidate cytidylyltransferase, partial [Bacteroidales bacterium]|nr:phosphatidate cytidylyltransferase [Bacteroidales bacterium]